MIREKIREELDKCFENICYAFEADDYERAKEATTTAILQAIRDEVTAKAKTEKDKWKKDVVSMVCKDKFNVGVHAGIEALEFVLLDQIKEKLR